MSRTVHIEPRIPLVPAASRVLQPLGAFVAVAACITAVLGIFWPTTESMVEIWRRSETFQHCFAVIPIVLWLVWDQRDRLAATPIRPYWPGLATMLVFGLAWMLGLLGTAQVISHFALIALVGATVLTVFGVAWVRVLWFPLLFLFFAVPFGEAIVPWLMDRTADFTVSALRLTGVPVYREGTHFVIPSGQWSVIEACSGIKFLIASIMAGSLYAWLMYRSRRRRALFLLASILVPLLANWLRAYTIVLVGHLSNNRLMTHEDHVVFGWILFGVAMLLMYWIGARWREDHRDDRTAWSPAARPAVGPMVAVITAASVSVIAWPVLANALTRSTGSPSSVAIAAPQPAGGWVADAGPLSVWNAELEGESARRTFVFRKGTQRVALLAAAYRNQSQDAQVGSSVNQLVRSTDVEWKQTARAVAITGSAEDSGVAEPVQLGELLAPRRGERLLVWQWYWTGGLATASPARTKLELARARLLRRPDTALWLAIYTPLDDDRPAAQRALQEFARDMGPALQQAFVETTR
ncbi:MAG TPA: exosortase A [Burkholderiaceae bacterium]|nr:exosortase A [Burkholderiaceae bacterium]